jgi:DNA polymerase-1
LLDRLYEATGSMKPVAEVAELDLRQVSVGQVGTALAGGAAAVVLRLDDGVIRGAAISAGGAQASYADLADLGSLAAPIADATVSKLTHDAKALERAVTAAGGELAGVTFDTLIGAYLLDPGTTDYGLSAVSERYLGTDLLAGIDEGDGGQLFDEDPWRRTAAEAATVGLLVPVMEEQIDKQGLASLLTDVELPLSSVLARMEARGIRLDGAYLDEMGEGVRDRMATRKAEIYERAGREFNLNSPPQLREVLYGELGLQPGKKTPKGELSTDASVLEKLRDEHPIVDALLAWRELDKLNSTYLEALPKLADAGGRIHTTFNQAAAATGRLSSTNPNLQNIPVRSELGREIRRAFVPGEAGQVLLVADYSQIELRVLAHLSGDEGLREAFAAGEDIHAATAAKVFDLPIEHVDGELRRRAKAVNFGLAYGMNAWGLAQRLDIAPDEAQEIIDGYFAGFPKIKAYLAAQVERARLDGYTETLLGRRRYIPELTSDNRRLRELGERQALNAPIQGGASDVFKMAMIQVDRALRDTPDLDCHMLLTVHDELVFEVPEAQVVAAAELVRDRMEHAMDLEVPLVASIGWGPNWSDAAPEGH